MLIKEFRIPMPMTLDEYQIGQLYTTVETSKLETGGGDGVEELANEPFQNHDMGFWGVKNGQYSLKKFHLDHKVPMFIRILTPKGCLHVQEESWNAFPYCRTILTNEFLGERLVITVDSVHLPDRGETENALNLPADKLQQREVIFLDIAQDQGAVEEEAYYADTKIEGLCSRRTGRGPLHQNWMHDLNVKPAMTCYKLVTIDVRIFGLTGRLESFIVNNQRRVFTQFQRRMVILMDAWYGMNMEDIRKLENASARELEHQRQFASARGMRMSASSQGGGGEWW